MWGPPLPRRVRLGGALLRSSVVVDSSLSFARFPAALQRPLPPTPESGCMEGGRHLLGGWKRQSPPGPLPLRPRPPCPSRVPPPRPQLAEQRVSAPRPEERATAGAHGRGPAQGTELRQGPPDRRAERRERRGDAGGSGPRQAGECGRGEPESGRGDAAVPVPVPIPGSTPGLLCSLSSSVLVLCVSAPSLRLFSLSLSLSIYCLARSLFLISFFCLLLRRSLPVLSQPRPQYLSPSASVCQSPWTACHSGL